MNIALIDVDGHASKKKWGATIYPNLALAKLAAWHKQQGDNVEWYTPFSHYDRVYMAKVFNFSPDYGYIINNADEIVKGGTGYDVHSKLPEEVDRTQPDYSIYPEIPHDYAYGFLTRGCPNRCPWCVVPIKEGKIVPYMDVDEIAVDGRHNLVLMDNNILAAGYYAVEQLNKIIERGYRVDFNQALDARLVTDEFAKLLAKVKWLDSNRIRFGCDTHKQIDDCEHAIELLEHYGFRGQFFLYTMIGGNNDLEECYSRINHWRRACSRQEPITTGATPTPMPSPIVILSRHITPSQIGKRIWHSGQINDNTLSVSTSKISALARASPAKNISLNNYKLWIKKMKK